MEGGGVGGKVAGIKITPGVRRDAGRGAPGETQVAGREARASRGTRGTGGSRDARHGRGARRGMRGESILLENAYLVK
jgi:hypothetical protein